MRYFFAVLLLTVFSSMPAIAESENSCLLTTVSFCERYGYLKGTDEFKKCMESAMKISAKDIQDESSDNSVGRLHNATGDVKVATDNLVTQAVGKGAPLKNNMTVSTGEKSHAVLKFKDGQIIVLQPNTFFRIHDYRYNPNEAEKSNVLFSMFKGGLRAITGLIGSKRPAAFRLDTRNATIGIRGTDFMVATDNQMYVQVTSGSISMANAAGITELGAGQTAVVASATTLPTLIGADALPPGTFSQLIEIPVPAPAPIEKTSSVNFCEDYNFPKGSPEYELCFSYAEAEGYVDKNGERKSHK